MLKARTLMMTSRDTMTRPFVPPPDVHDRGLARYRLFPPRNSTPTAFGGFWSASKSIRVARHPVRMSKRHTFLSRQCSLRWPSPVESGIHWQMLGCDPSKNIYLSCVGVQIKGSSNQSLAPPSPTPLIARLQGFAAHPLPFVLVLASWKHIISQQPSTWRLAM